MKVRSHPGATADDFNDYVWSNVRKKPNLIIIHTATNDIQNNVNTLQKIRKIISSIKEHDTDDDIISTPMMTMISRIKLMRLIQN